MQHTQDRVPSLWSAGLHYAQQQQRGRASNEESPAANLFLTGINGNSDLNIGCTIWTSLSVMRSTGSVTNWSHRSAVAPRLGSGGGVAVVGPAELIALLKNAETHRVPVVSNTARMLLFPQQDLVHTRQRSSGLARSGFAPR